MAIEIEDSRGRPDSWERLFLGTTLRFAMRYFANLVQGARVSFRRVDAGPSGPIECRIRIRTTRGETEIAGRGRSGWEAFERASGGIERSLFELSTSGPRAGAGAPPEEDLAA